MCTSLRGRERDIDDVLIIVLIQAKQYQKRKVRNTFFGWMIYCYTYFHGCSVRGLPNQLHGKSKPKPTTTKSNVKPDEKHSNKGANKTKESTQTTTMPTSSHQHEEGNQESVQVIHGYFCIGSK